MVTSSVRRAFRLIELVVVLGVAAILAGLILPAVLKVREASHRFDSIKNLHQIAMATFNSASSNGDKLPPPGDAAFPYEKGELAADGTPRKTGHGPPLFHIIPYVECDSLYRDSYSDEDGLYSAKRIRGKRIRIYQAPDDPTLDGSGDSCSYAVNELAFEPPAGKGWRQLPGDFTDGTVNTILYAEQYARQYGTWGTGWTDPRLFRPYTKCTDGRVPKSPPFQDRPRVGRDTFDGERPQSFRSGGLLVVMAAGNVRVIGREVNAKTFYEDCTPDAADWNGNGDW